MLASRETAFQLILSHRSATCRWHSALVARWSATASSYEIVCPVCGNVERFEPIPSLTAMWKRDPGSVPITVANRLAKRHRADIEAVAEGLPPELAATVREKYFGPQVEEQR